MLYDLPSVGLFLSISRTSNKGDVIIRFGVSQYCEFQKVNVEEYLFEMAEYRVNITSP